MDVNLAHGIKSAGDDVIERQVIQDILRDAYFAGIPPLTYLREKLAPAPVITVSQAEPPVQEFKCTHPSCTRSFGTQMALNGHMKKHAISNPS